MALYVSEILHIYIYIESYTQVLRLAYAYNFYPMMIIDNQCSSLKCAHAFQCEGLQNNDTFLLTLHQKKLDTGCFVLNMNII